MLKLYLKLQLEECDTTNESIPVEKYSGLICEVNVQCWLYKRPLRMQINICTVIHLSYKPKDQRHLANLGTKDSKNTLTESDNALG